MILFLGDRRQTFVLVEKSACGLLDLGLINAPGVTQSVENVVLLVEDFDSSVPSNVVKSDNTI